jgi:bifunctional UDP-N-acetylglucosamine pyrophosphorylase/glucosamine-1-phosphate N-acetyltransferase/UDP-N-acetylglucosamine pyrophosphorylase
MSSKVAVVLAAGKGTRMKSDLPKVLVPVCGRPMIDYVIDVLADCGIGRTLVVVGYRQDLVRQALAGRPNVAFVEQLSQLGTGHAVIMCRPQLAEHQGPVLIVTGDSPMIQRDSVRRLLEEYDRLQPACILGTAHKPNPAGLGRIVRDAQGRFRAIVEEKDATEEQRRITEVNLSCYVFNCRNLLSALEQLSQDNQQGEMYLTDCPGILLGAGRTVLALDILKPIEALSINTMEELAAVEAAMKAGQA